MEKYQEHDPRHSLMDSEVLSSIYTHASTSPNARSRRAEHQFLPTIDSDMVTSQQHHHATSRPVEIAMDPYNFYSIDISHRSQNQQSPALPPHDIVLLEPTKSASGAQLVMTLSTASSSIFEGIELQKSSRVLSLGLVLPICYFLTCGGPTGVESIVSIAGPLIALIGLIVFPILFSVPLGLLVSEMCTAFPDDGGFVIWVTNAFGPFWAFQEGFWFWISTVVNNAMYPSLILNTLTPVVGLIQSPVVECLVKAGIVVVISLPTLFGTRVVGRASVLMVVLVVVPTIVATAWFFGQAKDFGVLGEIPTTNLTVVDGKPTEVDWKALISRLFWCYDDLYILSLFGGQIANPSYTYPRAILITLLLMVVTYVVPLIGSLAVNKLNWWEFQDDSMEQIGKLVGGSSLQVMMVIAAVCSNAGLFTTDTFAQCYLVNGMAQQNLIPTVLSKRHYFFETPYLALLVNTLPVLLLLGIDVKSLLAMGNCLSSLAQLLLIAAAIKLRILHGEQYQFKKVLGGDVVVIMVMTIPTAVIAFVFAVSLEPFASIVVIVGVIYGLFKCQ